MTFDAPAATPVRLGRRKLGKTPLSPVTLPAGKYKVVFTVGGKPVLRHVEVRANNTTRVAVDAPPLPKRKRRRR